ncbi:hypothetical protein Bca52824_057739 [Brassica carinata]|uniref:Uncharacterized protein n=1 Tax=Brassica carinata TaxID=52824 RepID=A0A8X7QXZ9_BRACI|nr:hypothetical protein Bca52824_057739 [Brassica carinata]
MLAQPKLELQLVKPPIEMKRAIDKIVDFIQKNGMFPFLGHDDHHHRPRFSIRKHEDSSDDEHGHRHSSSKRTKKR